MMRHDPDDHGRCTEAVAPSSDEVRARLHAAREAKGKAPVDCWACEAFDEVIALLWEMHQAGYEQGLAVREIKGGDDAA